MTGARRLLRLSPADLAVRLSLALAGAWLVLTAGRAIELPGLQYDEILFVNAAMGEPTNGLFVAKRVLGVPVMLMHYLGALKAYLYYPIFKLFGVSPATIRWPVILVSVVTLGVAHALARLSLGRLPSALLVLVMAVDPTFIYMTRLDFGPVALMLLLKLTALLFLLRAVATGSPGYLWGMGAACGLGLFDKLNFIWFILALTIAGGVLFRPELVSCWRRDRRGLLLPLAALALVVGVATLRLILPQLAASQSASQEFGLLERAPYLLRLYAGTMSGKELYLLITKRQLATGSATNLVVLAGLWGALAVTILAWRRAGGLARMSLQGRIGVYYLMIFVLIGVQIWVTKKAWGPHHIMMLYPFQYFILFGAAVAAARRAGPVLVALPLLISSVAVDSAYTRAFRPAAEYEPQWSPVIYDLVRYLDQRREERMVSVDWGIHNQVYALGSAHTRAASRDRWPEFANPAGREGQEKLYREDFQGRNVLVLLHGRGWDIMPKARANFASWAASFGLTPVLAQRLHSPGGTTIFEIYRVDDRNRAVTRP